MRVLGLDISTAASGSVTCLEMDTAFGRFEIRDMHEGQLELVLDSLQKRPDRVITAVPVEISTFRNLQIATKDKKAIRAALEFELEDDLPFERENLHYDSVIMGGASGTGSTIHIGAVKRESFETHLNHLREFGIDPDVITTDAWAYRSLMSRLNMGQEPVLMIGIDADRTFFYVHHRNRPVLYREVALGVRTIERHLAETMGASQNEIQAWIRDVGVTGIDEQVSNAISDILELLLPEMKQTELAARASLKDPIPLVLVTGEGALIPGLMNWLESAFEKRVELFRPFSQLSSGQVNYSDMTEIKFAKALALAMTAIPADKLPALNLRKGPFSKTSDEGDTALDWIKKPLPYVFITAAVFFSTKTIEYNYYQSKLNESEDTLKRSVKSYFGGVSDNVARIYLSDPAKLKRNIEADLTREREFSKLLTPNPNSPLDFLKNLSQQIGKDVVVDLVSFDAGSDNHSPYRENQPFKATLSFIVSNAQVMAKLTELVEKNFNLKHGQSESVTHDGHPAFKITYSGTVGGK